MKIQCRLKNSICKRKDWYPEYINLSIKKRITTQLKTGKFEKAVYQRGMNDK